MNENGRVIIIKMFCSVNRLLDKSKIIVIIVNISF